MLPPWKQSLDLFLWCRHWTRSYFETPQVSYFQQSGNMKSCFGHRYWQFTLKALPGVPRIQDQLVHATQKAHSLEWAFCVEGHLGLSLRDTPSSLAQAPRLLRTVDKRSNPPSSRPYILFKIKLPTSGSHILEEHCP